LGIVNVCLACLPNYVGAVRTMVVAGEAGAYGKTDKTTQVKKPLMVLSSLPRVLGPQESVKIPVNLFINSNRIKSVTIEIDEKNGLLEFPNGATQTVSVQNNSQQVVYFDANVLDFDGSASFEITARGGGETATQTIELSVRNPNPFATKIDSRVIEAGQEWSAYIRKMGMQGSNTSTLEVSGIPPLNLEERMKYLMRYPYGCIEQTTSSVFPQLFLANLTETTSEDNEKIKNNIEAAINRIKQFQTSQGGFGYWPGNTQPNPWGSNYAGHFLLEAKEKGYTVPSGLILNWINFQKKAARVWRADQIEYGFVNKAGSELDQAYRLFTLALAKKPELSAMNRLLEQNNLSVSAKWRLAAAYAVLGKNEIANRLISSGLDPDADYNELGGTYGSSTRDQAMKLETLVLLDEKTKAGEVLQYLSDRLGSRSWYSTQTTAYALMAISKYVGDNADVKGINFSYAIGEGETSQAGSESSPIYQLDINTQDYINKPLKISNNNQAPIFVR
ncbi:MAG: alpha-2-macroglobulin family protein, partial [Bacteroidota bacterium]